MTPSADPARDPSSGRAEPGAPGRRRVVVAEDESLIRLDLVEMLRDEGYDVVGEAADGAAAVRLATELRPDLVILDVRMPVLDGISAAERIVAEKVAPVLMLTAFSQREVVARAREAGAMAYLVKPFGPADLVPAIEMALARHDERVALEAEVADLADRLETRKLVDRAKAVLLSRYGLAEADAFRWIQKAAMDKRLTMRQVAEVVLAEPVQSGGRGERGGTAHRPYPDGPDPDGPDPDDAGPDGPGPDGSGPDDAGPDGQDPDGAG